MSIIIPIFVVINRNLQTAYKSSASLVICLVPGFKYYITKLSSNNFFLNAIDTDSKGIQGNKIVQQKFLSAMGIDFDPASYKKHSKILKNQSTMI